MAATVQRKNHYVTFPKKKPEGFPDYMGSAKIGGMQCCYFFKGKPFPRGRYEFEMTTITIPAGFAIVKEDGTIGTPSTEPFIMPLLVDIVPEGGQPNFSYDEWHFCLTGGGEQGLYACAKPLLGSGTKNTRDASLLPRQIVFFYDDSGIGAIPLKSRNPDVPRDPNDRYYLSPMLLPNQNICYYLLPETVQNQENIIKKWDDNILEERLGTQFFVGVEKPLVFSDELQLFFTDEVKPFWPNIQPPNPV